MILQDNARNDSTSSAPQDTPEDVPYLSNGSFLRRHPLTTWSVTTLVLLAGWLLHSYSTRNHAILHIALPLIGGIMLVPFAVDFGHIALREWGRHLGRFVEGSAKEVEDWFNTELVGLKAKYRFAATGTFFAATAVPAFYSGGFLSSMDPWSCVALASLIALTAFASGVSFYGLLFVANVVRRLGRFKVRVEAHDFGIMSTGIMLKRLYIWAGIIWFVVTLSASWGTSTGRAPLLALALPALLALVGSFVVCQIPLHNRMVEFKRTSLYQAEDDLHKLTPADLSELDDARQKKIDFKMKEIERLLALPEWPFGWRALSGVLASSLLSISPVILKNAMTFISGLWGP